jgi:hypothetical protein
MLPLQNFQNGSVIGAAWLNVVDLLQAAIGADAQFHVVLPQAPTAGVAIQQLGNVNQSVAWQIVNANLGTTAAADFSCGDASGNAAFMEFQCINSIAQETGGVAGLAVNIGSSSPIPVQLCTNDTVRATIDGVTGVWNFVSAPQINGNPVSGNFLASKAANTNRASTTAVAADPNLAVTLPAGIYALKMYVQPQALAGAGGGFKFTLGNTSGAMTGTYAYTGGIIGAFVSSVGQTGLNGVTSFSAVSNAAPVDWLDITGQVVVTVAGVLSFQWAQASSNAVNTAVLAGSWMQLTKVG